jgi:hypothetical protein
MAIPIEKIQTSIILFDLVGYSQLTDDEQFLSIKLLSKSLSDTLAILFGQSSLKKEEVLSGIIPTGDGAFLILNHQFADYGLLLALSVRTIVLNLQARTKRLFKGVRTALHFGVVIPVDDLTGSRNFVGTGLNYCARLCDHRPLQIHMDQVNCEDGNWVIASDVAFQYFESKFSYPEAMSFRGTIKFVASDEFEFVDKHERTHRARLVEASRHVASKPPMP